MNRLEVLTNPEAFKEAFPDKADLVVNFSVIELLTLYLNIRSDFNYGQYLNKSVLEFHDKLMAWLGEIEVVSGPTECGIMNGVFKSCTKPTIEDIGYVQSILNFATDFQKALFEINTPGVRSFILSETSKLCGNVLLHCSDADFCKVINTIDIPFTTVSNLLTAIRADLLLGTDRYGRIRTPKDVFLVDLKASQDECVGVFASKL